MKPVRAQITAEIGRHGRAKIRPNNFERIESYSITTAMDTDSDPWSIDIGDPDVELIDWLRRDVEIRVDLFGGEDASKILKTGFTDIASYSDQGTLQLSGRDVSSLATDSQAIPGEWKNVRPEVRIRKEAIELGFRQTKLAQVDKIGKIYRDGSETYWEFWYRMARKKKMWLWTEPDGTLRMDELNYSAGPRYYFGNPSDKFQKGSGQWINITSVQIKKNTQTRVGEILFFGENGRKPFHAVEQDKSIQSWVRKPRKIIFDADVRSMKEARQAAFEEIFEGKVGSVEITITVPDPGFLIQQNAICALNVPSSGISGQYYIVGVTHSGDFSEGFIQTVRLRERQFALTRRVPDDPELLKDPSQSVVAGTVSNFPLASHPEWSQYFYRAAQKWHGQYPIDKFTAMLIGIADHETGIRNVREKPNDYSGSGLVESAPSGINGGEWFPFAGSTGGAAGPSGAVTFDQYRKWFSNDPGPHTGGKDVGVGPGQLTSPSFKIKADSLGGKSGELDGGRWMPEWNIMVMGEIMAGHLQGLPISDASISVALERYAGVGSPFAPGLISHVWAYIKDILPSIQSSVESASSIPVGDTGPLQIPGGPVVQIPDSCPSTVRRSINVALRQIGIRYTFGGADPGTGFDCSGLLVYSYKVGADLTIPHHTVTMFNQFRKVPRNLILPGDGVYFRPDIGHMGMFIADGYFLQAPQTGDVVKISNLGDRDDYQGATRFIEWPSGPPGPGA